MSTESSWLRAQALRSGAFVVCLMAAISLAWWTAIEFDGRIAAVVALLCALFVVPLLLAFGVARRQLHAVRDAHAGAQAIFETVMDSVPIGIYRIAPDGRIRYANAKFLELTGLPSHSIAGWLDLVDTADRERIALAWQRCRDDKAIFDESFRIHSSGTQRWIASRLSPERDRDEVVGYIGTISDITTQRLAEEARNRSDAQARAIVDTAVDAIVTIDSNGTMESFNRAAYRMFGYAPDEVIGHNVSLLMPAPHAALHDEYITRYVQSRVAKVIGIGRELEARRKDGSAVPIHLAISEVVVEGRRTFTGIMRDISLELSDKEEIRRQHERLSVTVRNAPMGIVTYRFGAAFESTNRAFESMIGYSNTELTRLDFGSLTHPEDRQELARLTEEARRGRIEQFSLRLRLRRKSGTAVHVVTHHAITHDQYGVPDLIITQVEDRTAEIRAQEAERVHQERLTHVARLSTLGEMAAGIAHEINQPLTAISMYAQSSVRMLDAGNQRPERLREALDKLTAQSLRAGAVIDRVQRLVRRQESTFELVAINELIGDILRLAESDARVNDAQIVLELADGLAAVNADPIQIQQVVLNLVRNGIDAMKSIDCEFGSTITIRTSAVEDDAIEVSVTDCGTGVADSVAEALFTPFTTTKANGMGMGLTICRSIIDAHGGKLSYRNNTDHGATFYFRLPVGDNR